MHSARLFFVVALLLAAMASAWSQDFPLHIKVLSRESHQFLGPRLIRPTAIGGTSPPIASAQARQPM